MSTRSKQLEKGRASTSAVSPTPSTSASADTSLSSTTRLSRLDEKNTLIGLNNRLAAIIDRNHQLESENSQLISQIESSEETLEARTLAVKETSDKESAELRKQLLASENARGKAQLAEVNLKKSLEEATKKIQKHEKDQIDLQNQVKGLKAKVETIERDLTKERDEKSKSQAQAKSFKADLDKLTEDHSKLKKSFEEAQHAQIDLRTRLQLNTEELKSKSAIHVQELSAVKKSHHKLVEELGGKIGKEYENKLEESVKALRTDCERTLLENKAEQEALFRIKEGDMKAQMDKLTKSLQEKASETTEVQLRLKEYKVSIETLEKEKTSLEKELKNMAENAKRLNDRQRKEIADLEAQVKGLQESKDQVINDYQDLMEIKVALDNEISTYRKLLESEEERLNISMEEKRTTRKRQWASR